MKAKRNVGIASFALIILVSILFTEHKNSLTPIDYILSKLGVGTWSNGSSGLHYTAVMAILLLITGIVGVVLSEDAVHKNFGKIVLLYILFGSIIINSVYSLTYDFVKANMDGLSSIEYLQNDSKLNFKSNVFDKSILFDGHIKLKNYSDETREFYLKLIFDKKTTEFLDFPMGKEITACDKFKKPVKYILPPKSEKILNTEFSVQNSSLYNGSGSVGFNVILFNENEEKGF